MCVCAYRAHVCWALARAGHGLTQAELARAAGSRQQPVELSYQVSCPSNMYCRVTVAYESNARLAQRLERRACRRLVAGSSPGKGRWGEGGGEAVRCGAVRCGAVGWCQCQLHAFANALLPPRVFEYAA